VGRSLTRGRLCRLQLLQSLVSAVIFESESRGTLNILHCLRFETFLFVVTYYSRGYGGGIRPPLHTGYCLNSNLVEFIAPWHGPRRKHGSFYCSSIISVVICLFAKPLLSIGSCIFTYILQPLPSNRYTCYSINFIQTLM
jgi:hypothetical protein